MITLAQDPSAGWHKVARGLAGWQGLSGQWAEETLLCFPRTNSPPRLGCISGKRTSYVDHRALGTANRQVDPSALSPDQPGVVEGGRASRLSTL